MIHYLKNPSLLMAAAATMLLSSIDVQAQLVFEDTFVGSKGVLSEHVPTGSSGATATWESSTQVYLSGNGTVIQNANYAGGHGYYSLGADAITTGDTIRLELDIVHTGAATGYNGWFGIGFTNGTGATNPPFGTGADAGGPWLRFDAPTGAARVYGGVGTNDMSAITEGVVKRTVGTSELTTIVFVLDTTTLKYTLSSSNLANPFTGTLDPSFDPNFNNLMIRYSASNPTAPSPLELSRVNLTVIPEAKTQALMLAVLVGAAVACRRSMRRRA